MGSTCGAGEESGRMKWGLEGGARENAGRFYRRRTVR